MTPLLILEPEYIMNQSPDHDATELRYLYRPRGGQLFWPLFFFLVLAIVAHIWMRGVPELICAVISWGFVIAGSITYAIYWFSPDSMVVLTPESVMIPRMTRSGIRPFPLNREHIIRVRHIAVNGQEMIELNSILEGTWYILRNLMSEADFNEVYQHLSIEVDDDASDSESDADSSSSLTEIFIEPMREGIPRNELEEHFEERTLTAIRHRRRMWPLKVFAVKLSTLASFVGGPMWLSDALKTTLGEFTAFAVAFLPCALLLGGQIAEMNHERSRSRDLGVVGALIIMGTTAVALYDRYFAVVGEAHARTNLMLVGGAIGVMTSVSYLQTYLQMRSTNKTSSLLKN